MEFEHEYASKGVANGGLVTGIIGTALGVLNGGLNMAQPNGCGSFENYKEIQKQLSDLCVRLAVMESAIAVNGANLNSLTNSYNGLVKTYIPSTAVATVSSTGTTVTG